MKNLSDSEYIKYMEEHYIKNNENRFDIMKDLGMTEYQFYKRNKELNIHRNSNQTNNQVTTKKKSSYKYDLVSGKWVKRCK